MINKGVFYITISDLIIIEAPKGKTGNVRFHIVEIIEKQSLKTHYSSFGYGILTAGYSGLCLHFSLYLLFKLNFTIFLGDKGSNQKFAKMDIPCYPLRASITFHICSKHDTRVILGYHFHCNFFSSCAM